MVRKQTTITKKCDDERLRIGQTATDRISNQKYMILLASSRNEFFKDSTSKTLKSLIGFLEHVLMKKKASRTMLLNKENVLQKVIPLHH